MKFFKRCLYVFLALIVLVPAALFILTTIYKQEIADALIDELNGRFALHVDVKNVDVSIFASFPQASVSLEDVVLDHKEHPGSEPLLRAEKIKVSFNLRKLLKKQFEVNSIAVETASINLVTLEDGSRNFDFKTQDSISGTGAGLDFDIHKIRVSNTQFDFRNLARGQHIAIRLVDERIQMTRHAEGFDFGLEGQVEMARLLFNPTKGAFLENTKARLDLAGTLYTVNKTCFIRDPSLVEIDGMKYPVNVFLNLGGERSLALRLRATNVPYHKGRKLLNANMRKLLANYDLEKPVNADLLLLTALGKRQEPAVVVRLGTTRNTVSIGNSKITYNDVAFKGLIVSLDSTLRQGDAARAVARFSNISGKVYDVPFKAMVRVSDFTNAQVVIRATLNIDAQKVRLKAAEEFDLRGQCQARLSYSGPASHINKQQFLGSDMTLRADLGFRNFSYKEKHKPYVYTINGRARVTNTDLSFEGLVLKTNGGDLTLKGQVSSFTPYVLGLSNKLGIRLEAYSNQLDLNPFIRRSTVAGKKSATPADSKAQAQAVKQLNEASEFDFNVSLKTQRMLIRKVVADDVSINLAYKNDLLNLRSVSMTTCGGRLNVSGSINRLQEIRASFQASDINVTTLFEQFENFGQQAIQAKQLKGKISLDAVFNAELDEKMEIVPYTMLGDVSLKLKEGHLIDYEPLQNVSTFIFHNRDFNDVTFSELSERFRIKGYEMQIEELEVASNILNLFVSGSYHFKSHSNINLVIPWNNLRRRGRNYIPKASGLAADDAKGLKLNFAGEPKHMKLSLGHK